MISKKVLYSEQLLQLVLALSLLQVDPINYLEWGVSRIHTSGIGPWQLEVAHTPFSEYPYMNRKNYVPLIEDLARYDRSHDVQAYLLNFDNAPPFMATNTNNNGTPVVNSTSNTTTADSERNNAFGLGEESNTAAALNLVNLIQDRFQEQGGNVEDIFLQSEHYSQTNAESIIDQNLADLSDYDDHQLPHFLAVPVKTEVPDPWDEFVGLRDGGSSGEDMSEEAGARARPRLNVRELSLNATRNPPTLARSAVIDWNDYLPFVNDSSVDELKKEEKKKFGDVVVKKEETDDVNEEDNSEVTSNVELTIEEMDLIEVLWKQDVDLGYNPIIPALNPAQQKEANSEDEIEKLKALLELKTDKKSDDEKDKSDSLGDPWAGLSYTVDTETGEYILQSAARGDGNELENLLLEEALQLVAINDLNDNKKEQAESKPDEAAKQPKEENSSAEGSDELEAILENNLKQDDFDFDLNSPLSILLDDTDELDLLNDMMIQPSSTHFQHPRQPSQNYAHCVNSYRQNGYQGRVPLSRTVSMEQRWQDLANLLSFPPAMGMGVGDMSSHAAAAAAHYSPHYPYQASGAMSQHSQFGHHHHHPHSHPAVLHNASLADIAAQPAPPHHYSSNLGSAVASSMHLTNSSSETDAGNTTYKMEHDLMYYSQQNPNELNHTNDGFLNSILNDEDLQLMDMAVNEGMYTMRMLDQNGTNSSALGPNAQLNQALLGNHMQTNLSSGIGSSASSTHVASGDRLDASSDSAVSSMGSERVASLSDGEWNEAGSDSAQEYHSRKFVGPYDYRFNNSRMLDANRQPVAQKKHQMYGKRFAHESVLPPPSLHPHSSLGTELSSIPNVPLKYEPYEPYAIASNNLEGAAASSSSVIKPPATLMESEMKYSYSIDFPHNRHLKSGSSNGLASHELINHNHTYTMPHPGPLNSNGATPRPQARDKKPKKTEDEHLTRDEKRARALHIPISVSDIINLPMDEFNERLSKYDLSENQLSLIRDIRRRGKNKVAAQNCRKRKLDQIISLADEVKDMKMRKERFLRDRELVLSERRRVKDKFAALYRHVFTNLRDTDGNPYSSYQYSLQQSADGSVVLVPRSSEQNSTENASANGSGSSRNNGHHSGPGSNSNSTNFK